VNEDRETQGEEGFEKKADIFQNLHLKIRSDGLLDTGGSQLAYFRIHFQ